MRRLSRTSNTQEGSAAAAAAAAAGLSTPVLHHSTPIHPPSATTNTAPASAMGHQHQQQNQQHHVLDQAREAHRIGQLRDDADHDTHVAEAHELLVQDKLTQLRSYVTKMEADAWKYDELSLSRQQHHCDGGGPSDQMMF